MEHTGGRVRPCGEPLDGALLFDAAEDDHIDGRAAGLGAGGQAGAIKALEILRSELVRDMALIGAARLSDIDESMLRRVGNGWPS